MAVATVYCTDEDIAIRAGGDFFLIVPEGQRLAYGTDGVLASTAKWTLTSAAGDFVNQGLATGNVVLLTGGTPAKSFPASGDLLAVSSVTNGNTLVLRRPGNIASAGLAPGPVSGSITGITYNAMTLYPQIEDVSYELNKRYEIDPNIPYRTTGDMYDLRELKQATVCEVLRRAYVNAMRLANTQNDTWAYKAKLMTAERDAIHARISIHWGPRGDTQPSNTAFSGRLSR